MGYKVSTYVISLEYLQFFITHMRTLRNVYVNHIQHSLCVRVVKALGRPSIYGSLSKNGGIVVLFNFLAYVPSIFLFLSLQHLATLWVNKTEYYVMCPMTLFENST